MKKFPEPSAVYGIEKAWCHAYRFYNIRMSNYEVTKKKYECVKPLGGPRVKHGITDHRPLTDRHRTFEVWHRDGDSYGIAFALVYVTDYDRDKATGKRTITKYYKEYKPLLMVDPSGRYEFTAHWMTNYVTWNILGAALPEGLRFTKYGAKQYICADQPDGTKKYYYQDGQKMSFVPYEREGKTYYEVIGGIRESKVLIDSAKAKKVRQDLKPFLDYYEIMSPFIDTNTDESTTSWAFRYDMREKLHAANWLQRAEGEEYGENWMAGVEALFHTHTHYDHTWDRGNHKITRTYPDRARIEKVLRGGYLYRVTKPYKVVAVDVGVPFYSNGRRVE
jgi:hypothetical protein